MTAPTPAAEVAREFWRRMATNDFAAVAPLLAEDFVLDWPQSAMTHAADVERAVHRLGSVMAVRSRPK